VISNALAGSLYLSLDFNRLHVPRPQHLLDHEKLYQRPAPLFSLDPLVSNRGAPWSGPSPRVGLLLNLMRKKSWPD